MAEGSPTVRRRELGALLRKLREEKGLSVKDVTDHLMCSASKVSRLETGERGATLRDVRDLCDLYGVANVNERGRLMTLAKEGKQQGWWQSYDLPTSYSTYVGLEAEATSIKDYDTAVVPGLLQTADYAWSLCRAPLPEPGRPKLTDDVIAQRVESRLRRQRLLDQVEHPFELAVIVDEAALQRVVGSPEVMRKQIERVIELSSLPNVTFQIVPFTAGAHPALDSTFNILEFSKHVSDVVYVEGLQGWLYMEKPEEVDRYRRVFSHLSQIALSPDNSVKFLSQISDSHARSTLREYRLSAKPRRCPAPNSGHDAIWHPEYSGE